MAEAEFEEKCVEGPLNAQLLAGSPYLFTPGQVLESTLGFDAAMQTQHAAFWAMWGRPPAVGAVYAFPAVPGVALPPLPSFRLNLFLQYKRPSYLERSNASEWSYWATPYFRYSIVPHQQTALAACAASLGMNGLVAYASPAFSKFSELFTYTENGTLVAATNFVEVAALTGHSRYTYVTAGNTGIAFSEPTEVESVPMPDGLGPRFHQAPRLPPERNILEIANDAITHVLQAQPQIISDHDVLERVVQAAVDRLPRDARVLGYLFVRVRIVSALLGWTWLVAGEAREEGPVDPRDRRRR